MNVALRRQRIAALRDRVTLTLRSIPLAAYLCAVVACLNAASWSLITPAFQVPDEPSHFAYVEQLARTGHLPSSSGDQPAPDEIVALEDLETHRVTLQAGHHTIASRAQQAKLQRDLAAAVAASQPGMGNAGVAASEPPLYYAVETIPYDLGASGGVLDQLALMRLVSALMAGATALFAFLFLREALPSSPKAWTMAGLGIAFLPLLGFISGAVNPETMLCAVSAAIFYAFARAFRRGFTRASAIAIGTLTAIGFLTKLNFLGLAPGIVLGLLLLAKNASRTHGIRAAASALALALVITASPVCLYIFFNLLFHHHTLGIVSGAISSTATHHSFFGELNYIWQLYLPRLPGMHIDFADISPIRNLWFNGLVGEYGYEDTFFPGWVDNVAVFPAAAIVAMSTRDAFVHRGALRRRVDEFGVYLAMAVGLLLLIGASSYASFPAEAAAFPEPRYLLPLIPLFGAVLALAARGAGRRWESVIGVLIVVLFLAHDIFSQLLVVARYYG